MTIFLDLSDVRTRSSGIIPPVPESSGYAYLPRDGEPVLGEQAVAVAKLHPTRINNRYLVELSTEPSSPEHPKVRHNADLVWHQLKQLNLGSQEADICLLVPASYTDETLQLLAGICQSLEINVQAFINRSVAGCLFDIESNAVHIDLQQNQTLLTFVEQEDGHLNTRGHEKLSAFGLARLQEHWLHALRQRFISSYRFDPMHSGDTEQQLFLQLHEKVGKAQEAPFDFSVTNNGQQYTERFSSVELAAPFQELLAEIQVKSRGLPLILDSYFSGVPGAFDTENQTILASDAYFAGALAITKNLDTETQAGALYLDSAQIEETETLVSGLSALNEAPVATGASGKTTEDSRATHLLVGSVAYPAADYDVSLTDQQVTLIAPTIPEHSHIMFKQGKLQIGGKATEVRVNAREVDNGQKIAPGDTISIGADNSPIIAIAVTGAEA